MKFTEKQLKIGRFLYVFEANFEYLISILVAGPYLATLTGYLGVSDSLTGIISAFISLGCLFQLFSIFIRKKFVKKFVVSLSIANQVLFTLLYVIPFFSGNKNVKTVCFVIAILTAYLLYYLAHPKKINWLMSLVPDNQRGSFTSNKEIISLLSGMAFQFIMAAVFDRFKEAGNVAGSFIVAIIVMVGLTLLHTLCMVFTVEKDDVNVVKKDITTTIKEIAKDKSIRSITLIFILYYITNYITVPFHSVYHINDLGLSITLLSLITISGSASRILVSKFWGKYADKKSFAKMIEKCFIALALGHLFYAFAVPEFSVVPIVIYTVLHGVALGGINSALTNLVFDYVKPEKRADSLAICQASSGIAGFLATLAASPIVTIMQKNNNEIFGVRIYAQQLLTILSFLLCVFIIIYVRKTLIKRNK